MLVFVRRQAILLSKTNAMESIMKKLGKAQKGFSIVKTLLLLIVTAIIGFIGWFVWDTQRSASQTLDDSNASAPIVKSTKTAQTELSKFQQVSIDKGAVTMSVPSDWTVKSVPQKTYRADDASGAYKDETTEITTVSSPDSKAYVKFEGFIGGLGGACNPAEVGSIEKVVKQSLPNANGYEFVQYFNTQGSYSAGMMSQEEAARVKNGANYCDVAMAGFSPGFYIGATRLYIGYGIPTDENTGMLSSAQYDKFVSSRAYSQAKAIILSVKRQ